jgi:hypothetical protein
MEPAATRCMLLDVKERAEALSVRRMEPAAPSCMLLDVKERAEALSAPTGGCEKAEQEVASASARSACMRHRSLGGVVLAYETGLVRPGG